MFDRESSNVYKILWIPAGACHGMIEAGEGMTKLFIY
jgi:hypothetical protein